MEDSPIPRLLDAIAARDVERAAALFTDDVRLLTADGRRASGIEKVTALLKEFVGGLRASGHRITAQWHQDDVWIAEAEASYELRDFTELRNLPRAFVVRERDQLVFDLRVYGAHEHSLAEHPPAEGGMWIGERWIPPL